MVQWDSSEFLSVYTLREPHFTANVISHCVRVADPTAALVTYLRMLCELDAPCDTPRYMLRVWLFEHSVMTPLDSALLGRHPPQLLFVMRDGGLRKSHGPDVIHGEDLRPITLPPPH